jgi:hypothetical protein
VIEFVLHKHNTAVQAALESDIESNCICWTGSRCFIFTPLCLCPSYPPYGKDLKADAEEIIQLVTDTTQQEFSPSMKRTFIQSVQQQGIMDDQGNNHYIPPAGWGPYKRNSKN